MKGTDPMCPVHPHTVFTDPHAIPKRGRAESPIDFAAESEKTRKHLAERAAARAADATRNREATVEKVALTLSMWLGPSYEAGLLCDSDVTAMAEAVLKVLDA